MREACCPRVSSTLRREGLGVRGLGCKGLASRVRVQGSKNPRVQGSRFKPTVQ